MSISVPDYVQQLDFVLILDTLRGGNKEPGSPGINKSSLERIDYSNDTATTSPKGDLSSARLYLGATGARENGFVPIGPAIIPNTTTQNFPVTLYGYYMGGRSYPSPSYINNTPY